MDLDELNQRVTNAITRAESLPEGSLEAWAAFREVASLEESIAALTPPDDVEGEIARVGAVTASLRAGEPLRALRLAQAYMAGPIDPRIDAKLQALVAEAHAALASSIANEPRIKGVTFVLRAA